MLTQKDFDMIEDLVDEKLFPIHDQLKKLDQIIETIDSFAGDLKRFGEEREILSHQVADHSDRIENLEQIHPQGQHPQVSA